MDLDLKKRIVMFLKFVQFGSASDLMNLNVVSLADRWTLFVCHPAGLCKSY